VSTRLRLAFALLAGMFAYIDHSLATGLPWILRIVTLDLSASALAYVTVIEGPARHSQLIALLTA
jgi:hypothetical protein